MRNIALLIEYDGTAYGGWQIQKNSRSIQAVLEEALGKLLRERIKVVGAGRTDSGVHAYGQVANFLTAAQLENGKLLHALNGILPEDIAIRRIADVPENFHSRFDATSRKYIYRVISRKRPALRYQAAFFPYRVSLDKMNEAAGLLIGPRNFKSFTKYADQQRSFICNVMEARWQAGDGTGQALSNPWSAMNFKIEANRFLHGMVRAIVGTLLDVGRGRLSIDDFDRIIRSEDRSLASMSAPACGLFLEEIRYGLDIWKDGLHQLAGETTSS